MSSLQIGSLVLAFLGPLALWAAHRRNPHPRLERNAALAIAALLLVVYVGEVAVKVIDDGFDPTLVLPMQLCDWARFAVMAALLRRSQTCFELGYFWGLCGTLQAIVTPAIAHDEHWLKQLGFFLDHAGIVAGVFFLLFVARMRPHGLGRVLVWSEIYLAAALTVNALLGANYGFLSHKPDNPSLLDLFSTTHWIYVLEINAIALVFFAIAYAPWWLVQRRASSCQPSARRA